MYCGMCGTKNDDGARFCAECGAPLMDNPPPRVVPGGYAGAAPAAGKSGCKSGLAALAVIAVAVVALVVVAFNVFGGRSAKKTVTQLMTVIEKADAKKMIDLFPPKMLEAAMEEQGLGKGDLEDFIDEMDDELGQVSGMYDFTYKVGREYDIKGSDLSDLKDDYRDYDVKVSAAKTVEVDMTVEVLGMEQEQSVEVPVIKVGRSWYLDVLNFDML